MESNYDHNKYESTIYKKWEESEAFSPPLPSKARNENKDPYCIIMPPPNANDPLHVGHAMFVTLEDILIRVARMQGKAALWLPGTDHAGIETQYVFEKKLKKKGKSRFSYDRESLFSDIMDYVKDNSDLAISQMKLLGASADWEHAAFTLDESIVDQVLTTFEKMHDEKLIHRQLALVNYCTKCGTGYSQLEINHQERRSPLYYLKYGPFELATVRPETKFGDTAIAVHPDDTRYAQYVGQTIEAEGLSGTFSIKVIADDFVDPEFGSGVVKVTPAHDHNDYAVWQRHKREIDGPRQVIGFDGKMTALAGSYEGLSVIEARKKIVTDLQRKGLINRVDESYENSVAVCYRCGRDIEPLPMAQFFIDVAPLVSKVRTSLDSGETKIHGSGHEKILRHWLNNLHDWNISRQIVWGIRMPIWYDMSLTEDNPNHDILVGFLNSEGNYIHGTYKELLTTYSHDEIETGLQILTAPENAHYQLARTKPAGLCLQETDTFDTWFSSSQWPVVTLKKIGQEYFDYYYPTAVMETGYDILPIWVMRMMLLGIYLTSKSPFSDVYLHGLVRDEKGQKMSKSKGNVINPIDFANKYGTDALRMALVISTTAGHDSAVGESKVKGMRNFSNKIWNAARFISMDAENNYSGELNSPEVELFRENLRDVVNRTTQLLNDLKIGQAAETLHNSFWHWFCDECIEATKANTLPRSVLKEGLQTYLKLLHPFMPFVTEAVWSELYSAERMLILTSWPES